MPRGSRSPQPAERALRHRGAVTQTCQSLLTGSPVGMHPIVWRILISEGRRPFSQTSANPCPRLGLGFPRGGEGQCWKRGHSREAGSVYTQQCWAPAPTGSCVCAHRWQRALLCAHSARRPPCSLPPSFTPSLPPSPFPPSFPSSLPPLSFLLFFQQMFRCLSCPGLCYTPVNKTPLQPTGSS